MRIFVVEGHTGEYSDHCEWYFAAYESEEAAQSACAWLNEQVRLAGGNKGELSYPAQAKVTEIMKSFDPGFVMDYTGTDYTYWSVEFYKEFKR